MERLFYSPTQYAKQLKEDIDSIGTDNDITEINYLISFKHIHQNTDYDNYYVKPIVIKVTGIDNPEEDKEVIINITKTQYGRMKLINEKNPDAYICLRTNTTILKTFSGIDGDHEYYPSKILLVPVNSKLHKQIADIEQQKKDLYDNTIEEVESDFTL